MKPAIVPRNETGSAPLAQDADPRSNFAKGPAPTKALVGKINTVVAPRSQDCSDGLRELQVQLDGVVRELARLDRSRRPFGLARVHGALSHVAAYERDLTPEQAAFELGLSASTVRRLCASGSLGRRHVGRWRIDPAEVRAIKSGVR